MIDRILLLPYYLTLKVRHLLYDKGILKSYKYDVPVISVGNITVGGTGKTPHVELIVKTLLQEGKKVAVLSRGYGRKTSCFIEVGTEDKSMDVGDEPLQIKRKYPDIIVVVDSKRSRAINLLLGYQKKSRPDVIILDDAFQHRQVVPSVSIVLVDYNRPIFRDCLLPLGRLRDLPERIKAADIVIVTKIPWYDENPDEKLWRKKLHLLPAQKLYFSKIEYSGVHTVFPLEGDPRYIYSPKAILFTGIASNQPFIDYLNSKYQLEGILKFGDHKNYKRHHVRKIEALASQYPTAAIITTEKDAQRLRHLPFLSDDFKKRLLYLQINVEVR